MTTQRRRPKIVDPMQRVREYPLRRLGLATQHDLVGTDRTIATRTQQVTADATRGHLGVIQAVQLSLVDASGGAQTVALPPAQTVEGQRFTVKKTDASGNTVTLNPNGAETVDGAATYVISVQWGSVTVQASDGAFYVVGDA